jgi:hemoglobin
MLPRDADGGEATPLSDFQQLGGALVIQEVVDRFYGRALADPELRRYFMDVDMARLRRHMALLLTKLLQGPNTYTGRDLGEAHRRLRVNAKQYRLFTRYLTGVLSDMGVDKAIVAVVRRQLAAVQSQITGHT